jgi:hypothetical protein
LTPRRALLVLGGAAALTGGCEGATHYIGIECVDTGSDKDLQAAIATRSTVLLCPGAVIKMTGPVTLTQGLTLETAGAPTDPTKMATILLGDDFPAGVNVAVASGGSDITIRAVRFDGNRKHLMARDSQIPLELGRGSGYVVDGCVFTDSPGWTHLHLLEPCDGSTITNNVVESAVDPLPHDDGGHWTDGLSISCAHTLVSGNHVNDISAVGIVYFGGPGSMITNNVVTETNTSAFSGINVGDAIVPDNTGVTISGNQLIATSPRYFHTGLAAGLKILGKTTTVTGVAVLDNTIEGMARYGLAVDGCLDCTIEGNQVSGWHPLPSLASCPASTAYVAAATAMQATGALQAGYVDAKIDNCEGEAEVLGDLYRMYAGDELFPEYLAFEVAAYSARVESQMDAAGLLRAEWDGLEARARAMCPATATAADLQSVWRRIAAAQYGMMLSPDAADASVRADLTSAPMGTPCSPPAP